MAVWQHERGGRLGPCVALAAAIHGGGFALSWLTGSASARAASEPRIGPVRGDFVDVDAEPAILDPSTTPAGGGSPVAGARPAATAVAPLRPQPSPPRRPRAAALALVSAVTPPRGDRVSSPVADDVATREEPEASRMAAAQATDEPRERDLDPTQAAAAAGVGPGASGGPGGAGAGWSAPAIRGRTAFGNGTHGALTGRVCFLPVGTLRISDVKSCAYVATVYTDTLDIPERQYSDGFPGVTNRSDWFLIDYTGQFTVTGYGTYVFRLHSDDGSYLYVDDALIIDNDGKHAPESRTGRVQLAVGVHRIKVRYAQTTDRMALQLFVRTPQGAVETIFQTQM